MEKKKKVAELKREFKKLGLNNKTACGELISASTVCFRCLDCDMPYNNSGQTPIICIKCFDKSNHDGHRLVMVKLTDDNTGYCDCGDAEMLKQESFCPDHQRSEVNRKEELEKFPKEFVRNCREVLNKVFYGMISVFEIVEGLPSGPERRSMIFFGQKFSDAVLAFIEESYTEINNSLLMIFNSTLENQFRAPENQLWHDCDNFEPKLVSEYEQRQVHPCQCTIAGVLARFCIFIESTEQPRIKRVLAESIKESEFNGFLSVELAKYAKFLFPKTYLPMLPLERNPILFTLNFQFSGNEASVLRIVQSEYFKNYIDVYQSTVNNYENTTTEMLDACEYFEDLSTWFTNPSYKRASSHLLKELNFPKYILETLSKLELKFVYPEKLSIQTFDHEVHYNLMGNGLRIQKRISRSLENNLKYISSCPMEEKTALLKEFAQNWLLNYQSLAEEDGVTFYPIMERILCYMLKSYQYEISPQGLEEFFKTFLPEVDVKELTKKVMHRILKSFGLIRFFSTVLQPDWQQLSNGYYIFGCIFFEVDVVTTQMMILLCEGLEGQGDLFESLTKSFFHYDEELKSFCLENPTFINLDDNIQKRMIVMKDFLNFMVYLMNDEICLLNLNFRAEFADRVNQDPNTERVVEKATVNLLLSEYWTDLAFVKENLKNCILIDDSKVNRIIPRVTIHNENDRKIRIKEEYEVELDPYLFYKMPLLQGDIINESAARIQKNPNVDIVAGKTYNNLQKHLKSIQKTLYRSELPVFLGKFIISGLSKENFPLVASVLKLIIQNLQVAVEFSQDKQIYQKVEENYLKKEFVEKLNDIQKEDDLKDCKACIEKIQNLLRKLQNSENRIDIFHLKDESEAERKKKQAQDKMRRIKEEFARKQALFADKNKEENSMIMTEESSSPEVTKSGITCQHCLAKIDQVNDTYGVPIYLCYTNNLYDVTKSKEEAFYLQDYGDLEQAQWWPVLSSCHHYYHKKCFSACAEGIQNSTENPTSQYESYCVLCKTLCNHFVTVHEGTTEEARLPAQEEQEEQFSYKLDVLLGDLRLRVLSDFKSFKPITMTVIVQRLLEYFIETFYLKEGKPLMLKKAFEFYQNVFRNFDKTAEKSKFTTGSSVVDLPILAVIFGKIALKAKDSSQKSALKGFLEYQLEPLIQNHLTEILIQGLFVDSNEENSQLEILMKTQLLTLKEYLEIKMLQYCITEQKNQLSNLKDCAAWLRRDIGGLIDSFIIKELLFPVQKILLTYHFNQSLLLEGDWNLSELCIALCNPQPKREYLNQLFAVVKIPYTIESLIEECIGNLDNESKPVVYGIIDSFLYMKDEFPDDAVRSRVVKLAPRNVELPQVYAEYNNTFYRSKCSLCKRYNKDMYICVCMICGDVICIGGCNGRNEDAPGNLNAHAVKYHMGASMYLDLFQLIWNIIDSPYNMEEPTKDIYIDTFGQPVQLSLEDERGLSELNFNDFTLNTRFMEDLRNTIRNHDVGKELFRALLNRPLEQIVPDENAL